MPRTRSTAAAADRRHQQAGLWDRIRQAGKYGEYAIDFPALAEHLYQLQRAAQARGVGLSLVILDSAYLPRLFATERGPCLQKTLPFMKGKPWVRHDEHYHVDFNIPCKAGPA